LNLKGKLEPEIFKNIEYVVVQSGVGLDLGKQNNTGTFDSDRLEKMISVCKKYGKLTKQLTIYVVVNNKPRLIEL